MNAVLSLLIDGPIIVVLRGQPSPGRSENNPGMRSNPSRKFKSGLQNRLLRRKQCKLREAVVKRNLLAIEVGILIVVRHLPANSDG